MVSASELDLVEVPCRHGARLSRGQGELLFDLLSIALQKREQRTSLHKGVFLVPEYFNNILVAYSHIKGTCIGGKFELNRLLFW